MRKAFDGDFVITQGFGNVLIVDGKPYYEQFGLMGHNGIDYATPMGTPIRAPHKGAVVEHTYDPGYGHYIKIESETEGSVLAHFSKIIVTVGFQVNEGDLVGYSGNSGGVIPAPTPQDPTAGAHLHWGYYRIPRNRSNGYNGYVDQTPYLAAQMTYASKYKPGETIEPTVEIAVGEAPGRERFEYGKVGPKYPARVISILIYNDKAYYNIDQSAIGGGTGYVRADMVDTTDKYTEKPPEAPAKYTEGEYKALQVKYEEALKKAEDERQEKVKAQVALAGFTALGFETPEALTIKLKSYDEQVLSLQKQILEITNRNSDILKLLQKKETEDASAIDIGIQAVEQLNEARTLILQIANKTGAKPSPFDILYRLDNLKKLAETAMKAVKADFEKAKAKASEKKREEPVIKEKIVKPETVSREQVKNGLAWLMNFFNLRKEVK